MLVNLVAGLPLSEVCGGTAMELTKSSGTVLSPGYFTGNYPNNVICKWRIKVKENMVNKAIFCVT